MAVILVIFMALAMAAIWLIAAKIQRWEQSPMQVARRQGKAIDKQRAARLSCWHPTKRATATATPVTGAMTETLVTVECVTCGHVMVNRRAGWWVINQQGELVQAQGG